jgi:hypothetical protein
VRPGGEAQRGAEESRARLSALVLGVALIGCTAIPGFGDDEAVPSSSLTPGLALRGGAFATVEDHLVELVVHEGYVYVANSSLGISAMSLDDNGGVTLTDVGSEYEDYHRCTNLAVHAPSDTLYCGSDAPYGPDVVRIEVFDISTPGDPEWRTQLEIEEWATRDLEVIGDQLLIHHFEGGLWTAQIDAEGNLSQLSKTEVEGNVRVSVGVDGRVVSLLGDPDADGAELRLLEAGTFTELDRLPLRGPPLGLSADAEGGARVGVGLGSGGMAIVAVEGDTLVLERRLEPPAVVTSGLVAGDLAIAVTLSGAFAWELGGDEPRMFGFGPSAKLGFSRAGNMLHGVIHEGELLTSDWLWVERWAIDRRGEVLALDVPRGIYLQPEGPVRWRMRNPGEIGLRAELWADRDPFWSAEVGPGEVVEVELPASVRAELLAPQEPSVGISVRVYDPEVPSEGDPSSATILVLAQREPDDLMPPATGDVFPTITLEDLDHDVYTMPTSAGSQTVWFWPDCALMWPQLEDLAWLVRDGWDLGRGEAIMLSPFDMGIDGFDERWGLQGASFGMWGVAAPLVGDANDYIDEEDIYMPFFIDELPGDAMPTDYIMDGDGVIRSIERMYRGPWTLVVPWPWE